MPPNVRTLRYTQKALQFGGGLNTQAPVTEIADNELQVCNNFYFNELGGMLKRPGLYKLLNYDTVGNKQRILGYDYVYGRLLTANSDSFPTLWSIFVNGPTATAVTGYGTEKALWTLFVNNVQYIGFTGSLRSLSSVSTVSAAVTNAPGSSCGAFHKDRLFLSSLVNPNRLHFSDPALPGTFQTTSTFDIGVDDTDGITGLVSLGDLLVIFKNNSTWVLYAQGDPTTWSFRKVSGSIGCINNGFNTANRGNLSYVVFDTDIYFISSRGLYKTNGSSFVNLSDKIWPFNERLYDAPFAGYWRLTRWNNTLIMLIGGSIFGRVTYTYNLISGAWSTWSFLGDAGGFQDVLNLPASPFGAYSNMFAVSTTTSDNSIYNLREQDVNDSGYALSLVNGWNSYSDGGAINVSAGSAYTATFQSKEYASFMDWYWRVKWASLEYKAYASPLFNFIHDGVSNPTVSPGFNSSLRKGYKIPGAGRCRLVSLNCSHAAASPFEFDRGNLHFGIKKHISISGAP